MNLSTLEIKIKSLEGISEVDFERSEAFKSSKLNYESAKKHNKSTIEKNQRNNINLKYSQNSQNDYSIKSALAGQLYDVLVDEGTLITLKLHLR
jgi:biotin carboxyl carrier protein